MIYMECSNIRVSEYQKILELSSNQIILVYSNIKLKIQGDNLNLIMMSKEELKIKGKIYSVNFYE